MSSSPSPRADKTLRTASWCLLSVPSPRSGRCRWKCGGDGVVEHVQGRAIAMCMSRPVGPQSSPKYTPAPPSALASVGQQPPSMVPRRVHRVVRLVTPAKREYSFFIMTVRSPGSHAPGGVPRLNDTRVYPTSCQRSSRSYFRKSPRVRVLRTSAGRSLSATPAPLTGSRSTGPPPRCTPLALRLARVPASWLRPVQEVHPVAHSLDQRGCPPSAQLSGRG